MPSSKPARFTNTVPAQNLNSVACSGQARKHQYRVHSFYSGEFSVLECRACSQFVVVGHDQIVEATRAC